MDWDRPCTSILIAVKIDTPCTSILLAVERDATCMPNYCPYCWWWKCIHPENPLAEERDTSCMSIFRPYCWWWKGIHPARPYCWGWKGIQHAHAISGRKRDTLHIPNACHGKAYTLYVHTVAALKDTPCNVHTAWCRNGYILYANTTGGGGRDTPCTFILLAVEGDTPCTSILLAVERNTPCTFILLTVERDIPCTSILHVVESDTPCTSIEGWWWWYSCYLMSKKLVKCWKKVSLASAFLPVVNCLSPASAFRYQGQSGTAGHGLVRHCPAMQFHFVSRRKMYEAKPEHPSEKRGGSKLLAIYFSCLRAQLRGY